MCIYILDKFFFQIKQMICKGIVCSYETVCAIAHCVDNNDNAAHVRLTFTVVGYF